MMLSSHTRLDGADAAIFLKIMGIPRLYFFRGRNKPAAPTV
jgi:hypothetical protein